MGDAPAPIGPNDWVAERLAEIDRIAKAFDQIKALLDLASELLPSPSDVFHQALTAADNIQNDYNKAQALSAIAPHLPESEQRTVLERALTAANTIQNNESKAQALGAIAPCLPESDQQVVLERALTAADNIKGDRYKAEALSAIAPCLPESDRALLERALTAADTIQADFYKAQALGAIAPRLPESDRALLERALTAADNIKDDFYKVQALGAIAPCLPESDRALLERALTAADTIEDDRYKVQALGAIAPCLPESDQQVVLERALTAADNIKGDRYKAEALSAIAPCLPESDRALLERALTAADTIQADFYKAQALGAIAPRLPESDRALLERALTAADNIKDDFYKVQALSAIAPCLPESDQRAVLERALTAADTIEDDDSKAQALGAIAPCLPESDRALLERALTAADTIQAVSSKAQALGAIASRLPESDRALLERALTAADNIQADYFKAQVLGAIAPQISQSNLKYFLEATFSLSNAAQSLASPAIRFTKEFLQLYPSSKHSTAINIVQHIPEDADKTKFLSALTPRLAVGLLPNALRLIQEKFTTDRYRTETLNNLVAYLPTDQTPEALNLIAQSIKNPYYKTAALVELIPLLPIECCDAVLNLLEAKIALPQYRARVLQAIAKALTTPEQTDKLVSITSNTSPEVAQADEAFLTAYQHLVEGALNLTYQLKEPKRDDFSYERAAFRIFSQLAPVLKHLAEPEQTAVLNAVKALEDPGYQAAVLIALAPHCNYFVYTFLKTYTGDDYRHLLRIKLQLAIADSTNPQALRPIADQLNNDKIPYIKSPYRNAEAWVELASHPAGKNYQTKALRVIQELQNNAYLQTQYLQRLIPHLAYQQRLEAVNITNDISDPYHRVSARIALARKFPESEFLNPARDGALALGSKVKQIEQLSTLAIDMPELLPKIIKLAETAEDLKDFGRYGILVALTPHLPMRINREVTRSWALTNTITDDLWDRALYLLARSYRDALTGGSLRNESAQDKDYLNLQDEIKALSELLLMRDLEPPMAVGILGGWGGGKSYIMHLMQAQMTAIRSHQVDLKVEAWNENPNHEKLSPYVGHIYQIKFDAWTFAKSDLWASLMQTIFFELNRQISLEQELQVFFEKQGIDPYAANSNYAGIWQALYKASDEDRNYFLQQALNLEDLDLLKQGKDIQNRLNTAENLLWSKFGETKEQSLATLQEKRSELQNTEAELFEKQNTLEQKRLDLEADYQRSRQEIADRLQKTSKNKLEEVIKDTLGVSGLVLKKRLGPKAFRELQQQIIQQLPEDVDIDNLQTFGAELREAVAKVRYCQIWCMARI